MSDLSIFSHLTVPQRVEESVFSVCPQGVEQSVPLAFPQVVEEPLLTMYPPQELEVHNSLLHNVDILNHAQSSSQVVDDSACVQQVAGTQEQIGTSSLQSAFGPECQALTLLCVPRFKIMI